MVKYEIEYSKASSGFCNTEYCNNIKQVEYIVSILKQEHGTKITVWDNEIESFIFYKFASTDIPQTDLIWNFDRDLRTKTRRIK